MNPTRTILSAIVSLLFCVGGPALHAQFAVSSHTIDGGGGTSAGGEFSLQGSIGQPDASMPATGGIFAVTGGFWAAHTNPYSGAYAAWAAANIPAGLDASFEGDANSDGIANGLVYVFGDQGVQMIGRGLLTGPPMAVPGDIDLDLFSSTDLVAWTQVLSYTAGVQTMIDPALTITNGEIADADTAARKFYQYRLVLIP